MTEQSIDNIANMIIATLGILAAWWITRCYSNKTDQLISDGRNETQQLISATHTETLAVLERMDKRTEMFFTKKD